MTDITQILTDPALCSQLQTFDPHKLVGLAGAPAVEQAVQYLKDQWGLSSRLASLAAIGLGVLLNLGIAYWLGLSMVDAVVMGMVTGAAASGVHIVKN